MGHKESRHDLATEQQHRARFFICDLAKHLVLRGDFTLIDVFELPLYVYLHILAKCLEV